MNTNDFSSNKAILTKISWIFEDKLTPCDGKSSVHTLRSDFRGSLIIIGLGTG